MLYKIKMKIIIVGTGWYGLHTYLYLKKNYPKYQILVLEKNSNIFCNSSNFNQNRLHLGYHYPRCSKTRKLCLSGYQKFINSYRDTIDFIDNNYYVVSSSSILDYETYLQIFANSDEYDHTIKINNIFKNIDGNIINTKEKIINADKAKRYFLERINLMDFKFEFEVKKYNYNNCDKIIINDEIDCDLLIDCSYNQLQLSKQEYLYELTISLIYNKFSDIEFESITIMDGEFLSLFPRDINKKKFTLTHVKYTPLIKTKDINEVFEYKLSDLKVQDIRMKMENDIKTFFPDFFKNFRYDSYFTSYKCKLLNNNDSRECNIDHSGKVISVNCGKITGIFQFEDYLNKFFDNNS